MGPTEKTGFFPGSSGLPDPHLIEKKGGCGGAITPRRGVRSGEDPEGIFVITTEKESGNVG
jgi:hypothetical protein